MRPDDMDLANRYLDGELHQGEKTAFEERLDSEAHLRTYVDEVRALDGSAIALEVFKAPKIDLSHGVRLPYRNMKYRIGPFFAGAVVSAACILIGIGVGTRFLKPPAVSIHTEAFRIIYHAPGADSVSVLGDFNGWSSEIPLKPKGEGGYWFAEIQVKPGEYRYVLMVDGKERPGDPLADYVIDDDFGSKNSVVRIGL
jgi:hypothetical protein